MSTQKDDDSTRIQEHDLVKYSIKERKHFVEYELIKWEVEKYRENNTSYSITQNEIDAKLMELQKHYNV